MKKIINLVFVILFLTVLLWSCTKEKPRPTARAVQIILDTYSVYEPNPLYADEAKEINGRFRHSLINHNTLTAGEKQKIHLIATAEHEPNNESALEDAVDEARVMMTRSLCMATAAVVSEPIDAAKYFEAAKVALRRHGKVDELQEEQYSALLVLEALYLSEHKILKDANKGKAIATINNLTHLRKTTQDYFVEVIKDL